MTLRILFRTRTFLPIHLQSQDVLFESEQWRHQKQTSSKTTSPYLPLNILAPQSPTHLTSSFQCSFESRLASFLPWNISGSLVTLSKKPAGIVIYVCGHTLKWRGKIKTDLRIEAMCQNCWVWCIFVVGRGRRENCWESVETMHEGGELLSHLLLSCNTGCERNWQCDCSNSTTETETCVFPIVCGEKGAWINWNKNFFTFLYKYTKSV